VALQLASKLIDTHALWNVVWVSLLGGVGGTTAFSVAIAGTTRFVDLRREGRSTEAGLFAVLAGLALALFLGGVVLGLYEIIKK
jgi:hypothetical protein